MKKTAALLLAILTFAACSDSDNDSVKQAHLLNLNAAIDDDISDFMTHAADARLMDIEEGKLAKIKGTNDIIKNYGDQLVRDNTTLLEELKGVAASKHIVIPTTLGTKSAKALEGLRDQEGKDFDTRFLKMVKRDHRRDLDSFEDAADFNDRDIQQFAQRNIRVFEKHLAQVEQVQDSNERITEGKDGNE